MKFLIKHNLIILSLYSLVMLGVFIAFWDSFSLVQRFTIGFLALITLHEWEETRFQGGFMEIMGDMLNVNISKVPAGTLHMPQAIYITVITLLPLLFPGVAWLFLSVMILGVFEGVIHVVGIKLTCRKKPYTPGMITGEVMLVYSAIGIYSTVSTGIVVPSDWPLAVVLFAGGFLFMQASLIHILDLKPIDAINHMKIKVKSIRR